MATPAVPCPEALLQKKLRFVFGITAATLLTVFVNVPLGYLIPVFLVGILSNQAMPALSFKQGAGMMAVFVVACMVGLLLTLLLAYPLVCTIVTLLLLWHIFLYAARGGSPLMTTMLTVAITVIPVAGMEAGALSLFVAKGLSLVGVGTVLIIWMSFWAFPDLTPQTALPANKSPEKQQSPRKEVSDILSATARTTLAAPAMIVFFYGGLTTQLLTLVFICILLQTPDLRQGVKGGIALLLANMVGGVMAILFYNLMVAIPEWWALVLLTMLLSLVASPWLFSTAPHAPLFATAFSTVLLLVGSVTGSFGGEADAKFYARLLGIGLAVLYLITSLVSLRAILVSLGKLPPTPSGETAASTSGS